MRQPVYPTRSVLLAALLCAGWLCAGRLALAAETHAEETQAAKPARGRAAEPASKEDEGKSVPKAHEAKPGRAVTARGVKDFQDPMDRLRERLAEKLGGANATDPNMLRVVARSLEPTPASPIAKPQAKVAHAAAGHLLHWDYQGEGGPKSWGKLKPEFAKCSSGARQSPIDIRDGIKVQLDPVQFDYKASAFRVIDNGHTVQVNVAAGNGIEVIGRRYELVQFHFHRPSEERIDGRQFDMVAHLVHKDVEGRLAVVAVLLDRGSAHPIVQTVWNNLPLEKGEEVPARATLDLNALLPAERSYFTYMGSLTTPPCSEGVLWMVMKEPVPISSEQIGIFARLYPMNARPIQSASGRLIKESN
jgi:carbonic anhydrase